MNNEDKINQIVLESHSIEFISVGDFVLANEGTLIIYGNNWLVESHLGRLEIIETQSSDPVGFSMVKTTPEQILASHVAKTLITKSREKDFSLNALRVLIQGVARDIEALETSSTKLSFPTSAPFTWPDNKLPGENPAEFTQRVYGDWLGNEDFGKPQIRRLDPKLYNALSQHIHRHGMPEGMKLSTLEEQNTRWAERVKAGDDVTIQGKEGSEAVKELQRKLRTLQRRSIRDL